MTRGTQSSSSLKVFLKRMKHKRPLKVHPPNVVKVHFLCVFNCLWKVEFSSQPISEYWNQTTTLIPFLQAIKHFWLKTPCMYILHFVMKIFGKIDQQSKRQIFWFKGKLRVQKKGWMWRTAMSLSGPPSCLLLWGQSWWLDAIQDAWHSCSDSRDQSFFEIFKS